MKRHQRFYETIISSLYKMGKNGGNSTYLWHQIHLLIFYDHQDTESE